MSHNTHRVSAAMMTTLLVTIFATACSTAQSRNDQFLSDNSGLERGISGSYINDPYTVSGSDLFYQQMIGE